MTRRISNFQFQISNLLLIAVLLLAALVRFVVLDKFPPGVTPDEIQQGYSAYSMLQTGRDEWGDFLPIFPRSFGDYRPPLYEYTLIPSVALFGLNVFAIRFPAALFGVLSVLVLYFLVKELFKDEEDSSKGRVIGVIAGLILAISAWHTFFSRVAWESNVGVLLFLLGIWIFFKSFRNHRWLILSAVCFSLTIFSYYSFKLLTPLFVFGLLIIYRDRIFKINRRILISAAIIFGVFFGVMVLGDVFGGGARRAADTSIFNSENLGALRNTQVEDTLPQPWGRVINNRVTYLFSQFAQNYLGYFSTTFLASPNRDDSTLFNLQGQWLFSIWEILFIGIGLFGLVKSKHPVFKLILLWAILAPIPGALTRNYMHTQRVYVLLLLGPILASYGIYLAYKFMKNKNLKFSFSVILGIMILYSLAVRLDYYYQHQFNRNLGGVHYGYDEITKYTEQVKNRYDQVIFTKQHSEPQIFIAFYSKWNPREFQTDSQNWKKFEQEGFKFLDMTNYHLGKYYFKNIKWDEDKKLPNTLIIGSDSDIPDGIKPIFVVKDPFGKVLFKTVDTSGDI